MLLFRQLAGSPALPRALCCWRCWSHVVHQLPEQSGVLFGGVRGASLNWRIMGQDTRDRRPALASGIEPGLAVSDLVAVFGPRYQRRSPASGLCVWTRVGKGARERACVGGCVSRVSPRFATGKLTKFVRARGRGVELVHNSAAGFAAYTVLVPCATRTLMSMRPARFFDSRRRPRVSPNLMLSQSVPFIMVNGRNRPGGVSIKHGLSMRPVSVACLSGCLSLFFLCAPMEGCMDDGEGGVWKEKEKKRSLEGTP